LRRQLGEVSRVFPPGSPQFKYLSTADGTTPKPGTPTSRPASSTFPATWWVKNSGSSGRASPSTPSRGRSICKRTARRTSSTTTP